MLQVIRERAQGWIAWFIVILISVPFALWGIQSYLGGGADLVVATVNGQEITERDFENGYRQMRQRMRDQLGANYRPELIDETRLRREYLDSMIRNQLIIQASEELGFGAADEMVRAAITAIPAFQVGGRFNRDAYENGVRRQGMTTVGFEAQVRQALINDQLNAGIGGSELVTSAEVQQFVRLRLQQRDFSYLTLPTSAYSEGIELSDEAVRDYYDNHQNEFIAPERVKVEYLELNIDGISATLNADDESIAGYYEQHKQDYVVPEQRQARHILITVEEGADESVVETARQLAQSAYDRVQSGEDFAIVAKELSQDPGSADMGGDLGFFGKGVMVPVFENQAFSMAEGEISEPLRSEFGFHVIQLTGIRAESGQSLEEAKDQVKAAYLKNEAERLFYDYAERLNDLAYEDPSSLEPAAEALGLEVSHSDWLVRDGGSGIFASTKLLGAAFGDDVLIEKNNSEVVEIGPEHVAVLRVSDHEEAALRPFEEVKAEITDRLIVDGAAAQAERMGEAMIEKILGGASFSELAAEQGVAPVDKTGVGRDDRDLPQPLINRVFKLPHPQGDQPSYGGVRLTNGDYAVVKLNRVVDGTTERLNEIGGEETLKSMIERSRSDAYFRHLVQNLRASADIVITRKDQE